MLIPHYPTFVARLKSRVEAVRKEGHSISELSEAEGLDPSYISSLGSKSRYRPGPSHVMDEYLPKVAKVLNCDVAYLTLEQDHPRRI